MMDTQTMREALEQAVREAVQLITIQPKSSWGEDADEFASGSIEIDAFVETIVRRIEPLLVQPMTPAPTPSERDAMTEARVEEIRRMHANIHEPSVKLSGGCHVCELLTHLDALQKRVREVEGERDSACENWARAGSRAEEAEYKLAHAEQRVEQMIVQMAGVSTAAMGWISEPAKEGDYGWSVPYEDVLKLRRKFDLAEQRVAALEGALSRIRGRLQGIPVRSALIQNSLDDVIAALAPPQAGPKEQG